MTVMGIKSILLLNIQKLIGCDLSHYDRLNHNCYYNSSQSK